MALAITESRGKAQPAIATQSERQHLFRRPRPPERHFSIGIDGNVWTGEMPRHRRDELLRE